MQLNKDSKSYVFFLLGLVMLVVLVFVVFSTETHAKLNSPRDGILCDSYICADKNGLSKDLTVSYLNQSKARAITGSGTDLTQFTYSDGTFCDAKTKLCHVDRHIERNGKRSAINYDATEKLFGS